MMCVFPSGKGFCFFTAGLRVSWRSRSEPSNKLGSWCGPVANRRLALVFASRPASIRTLVELLSSVPDGVPRFGWGAAISATASTRPRRRTQSAPYRRLCFTSCPAVAPVFTSANPTALLPPSPFLLIAYAAAATWRLRSGSYTSPEIHNRCSSTASLRATATTARFFAFFPPRSQMRSPNRRRSLSAPCGPSM